MHAPTQSMDEEPFKFTSRLCGSKADERELNASAAVGHRLSSLFDTESVRCAFQMRHPKDEFPKVQLYSVDSSSLKRKTKKTKVALFLGA